MKINSLLKKISIISLIFTPYLTFAQLGVNSDNSAPSTNAMLDVKSTTKGVLIPRVGADLASPSEGLLYYNTTGHNFRYYDGTAWQNALFCNQWNVNGTDISYSLGRVGIGTTTPVGALNIFNTTASNIYFHNPSTGSTISDGFYIGNGNSQAGLVWNKENAAIKIGTNDIERMTILSNGYVGIGYSVPFYKLSVNGDLYSNGQLVSGNSVITGNSRVDGQLSINTSNTSALLYLKGTTGLALGSWGQHIIMESSSDGSYGGIVYDTDGMKFRNFEATDNFYFRNSANTTTMTLDEAGNMTVGGKGIVKSENGTQMIIEDFATPANINYSSVSGNFSAGITLLFNTTFSSAPSIAFGRITGMTNPENIIITIESISNSSAIVHFKNVGNTTSVANNAAIHAIVIGNK